MTIYVGTYSSRGFGPDRRPEPGAWLTDFTVDINEETAARVHAADPEPVEVGFADVTIPAGIVERDADGNPVGGVTVHICQSC